MTFRHFSIDLASCWRSRLWRSLDAVTLRWAVGIYCLLAGLIQAILPHSQAQNLYSPNASAGWGFGLILIVAGLGMLSALTLSVPRWLLVAIHILAGGALIVRGTVSAWVGGFYTPTVYMVFVGAAAVAALSLPTEGRNDRFRDLFGLTIGSALLVNSLLVPWPPLHRIQAYRLIAPYVWWYVPVYLLGGLALIAANVRDRRRARWTWLAYLAGGASIASYLLPFRHTRPWVSVALYGLWGSVLAASPAIGFLRRRASARSLRVRFAATLALFTCAPIVAVTVAVRFQVEADIAGQAFVLQQTVAAAVAHDVDQFIDLHLAAVAALAAQPGLMELSPARQTDLLERVAAQYPDIVSFGVSDASGVNLAKTGNLPLISLAGSPIFEDPRRTNRPFVGMRVRAVTHRPYIVLSVPVTHGGGFRGLVTAGAECATMARLISAATNSLAGEVYLVDSGGRLLIHPDAARVAASTDLSGVQPVSEAVARTAAGNPAGSTRYYTARSERVASYAAVPDLGWIAVVDRPAEVAFAGLIRHRNFTFTVLIVAIGLGLIAGAFAAGRLARDLRQLAAAAERLADGNHDAGLPKTDLLELQALTRSFASMRERVALRTDEREVALRNATLANEALEGANRELEAFSYSVSHDLRAPLRGIDGWSLALFEDYWNCLDERGREYLLRVRAQAQHMGALIDGMLKLARISRMDLQLAALDVSVLAHAVATRLRESHPERDVEFRIQPDLRAFGDRQLLEILLTNLMGNAVKFTNRRARALVEIAREGDVFIVRDNGTGFDMKYAGMLFGAFQRLHKASEYPGTGIGLATAQRIVHRHRGHIWAQARPEQGAAFFFTLGDSA